MPQMNRINRFALSRGFVYIFFIFNFKTFLCSYIFWFLIILTLMSEFEKKVRTQISLVALIVFHKELRRRIRPERYSPFDLTLASWV